MADSRDELQAQLALMNKINVAMQQMATSASRVRDGYAKQLEMVKNVHNVINDVTGGLDNGSFDQLAESIKKVASSAGELNVSPLQELINKSGIASGSIDELGDKFIKAGKQAGFMSGFVSGLVKSFKGIIATSRATFSFFGGVVDWLGSVAAAIVAIPLRILEGLVNLAVKSAHSFIELRREIEEVRKQFGDLKGPGSSAILHTTKTLKGFSDTGLSAYRVFGRLHERLQKIREVATAMGATFSVLHKEFVDNGGAILAYQKGLGIADDDMKAISDRAISMGDTLTSTLHDISKQSLGMAKTFGLDQKLIARDISKATKDVHHFGQVTVKEIGVAVVYAKKLGLELDKITGTLDAFETFDTAAENAAKLSQAFGVQIDAFKLMEAQNPAEQIDMLRQQFKAAGVDASKFNRQQLKLLSTSTGLDDATAKQAFSAQNYGVSLRDVQKQAEASEKKTLTQAEAMSKLADSIERMIKEGPALQGSFFRTFIDGFLRGVQVSRPFMLLMRNIRQALRSVLRVGVQFGRSFVENFDGVKDALNGLAELFEPKRFSAVAKGFLNSFNDLMKGKIDVSGFIDNIFKDFAKFIDAEGETGKKVKDAFIRFFKKATEIAGPVISWAGKQIGRALTKIADFISGKEKLPGVDLSGTKSLALQLFEPIAKGFKEAWPTLKKGLDDIFDAIADRIVEIVNSDKFEKIAKKIVVPLALALFGPAVVQGIIVAATPLLFKGLFAVVKGAFTSKSFWSVTGNFFKNMGTTIISGFSRLGPMISSGVKLLAAPLSGIATAFFAALNVSDAFDKFGEDLTKSFGEENARIGTGVAGLIDTVTLGLLPEKWIGSLADNVAEISDWMDQKIGTGLMGDLYKSLKEGAAKVFEFLDFFGKGLSNIGEVWGKVDFAGPIKQVLKGDKSITDAYMEVSEKIGNAVYDATHKGAEKGVKDAAKAASSEKGKKSAYAPPPLPTVPEKNETGTGTLKAPDLKNIEVADRLLSVHRTLAQARLAAKKIAEEGPKLVKTLATGGVQTALSAVKDTVGLVQDLDDALSKAPSIDVSARLDKLTQASGIGKHASYTVKSKDVVINLNLAITMDVDKVERVMVMRKESIIRDRLNFATVTNPGNQATQPIPEEYAETIPKITRR